MNALLPIPMRYRDATPDFPKGWYCVAEGVDVSADAMLSVSYLDRQLVVYRTPDGAARVADAFCPHLGAHLASHDGHIAEGQIVCPFHKWRFDAATGRCVGIPYSKIIPPQATLSLYPTREVDGVVYMWWHPRGDAPDFEPYDAAELDGAAAWLLTGVKTREGSTPFRDLFENLFDTAHIQQLHNSNGMPDIEAITRTDFGLRVDYGAPKEPEQFPLERMQCNFSGLSAMTQIAEGPGFAMLQNATATPIDHERLDFRARLYIRDTGSPEMNEMLGAAFVARTMDEIDQDFKVTNYKKHLSRPLICAGDGPIMRYRSYAEEFYA